MKTKFIISCQAKEWYGDEGHVGDHFYGRYKMKGGQQFIFEADDFLYDEAKIISNFNKKYDKVGRFYRYEAKSIDWYDEPQVAQLTNDFEIIIPWTDPLDNL
jgi:hypothetical protein